MATLVIAYSVGAGPQLFSQDDIARYLADNDPVAGSSSRPASPGNASGGAGHVGAPSGGGTGATALSPGAAGAINPGTVGGIVPAGTDPVVPVAPGVPSQGPGGSGSPPATTPPTTSTPGILFSTGGSVVASCTGTTATLHTWTPKPGYSADDVSAGPATEVSVKFKSDTAADLLVVVTCPQGTPTLSEQVIPDHGGTRQRWQRQGGLARPAIRYR